MLCGAGVSELGLSRGFGSPVNPLEIGVIYFFSGEGTRLNQPWAAKGTCGEQ